MVEPTECTQPTDYDGVFFTRGCFDVTNRSDIMKSQNGPFYEEYIFVKVSEVSIHLGKDGNWEYPLLNVDRFFVIDMFWFWVIVFVFGVTYLFNIFLLMNQL